MQRLPTMKRAPLTLEQRRHLAEVAKIRTDAREERARRTAELAATEAAAVAKTTEAHRFSDDFEMRQAQAAAEGRDRARMPPRMDY
jgi:hypothetical protein